MSSWVLQLFLSLALFDHGGACQPVPVQPLQASFAEGTTAILQCRLEHGKIQDYHVFWFRQKPGDRPAQVLKHHDDGHIDRVGDFGTRFVPIRDAGANAYVLQIQGVHTEDSATYWCMAETNHFNTTASGAGTQLIITGGKSAKEPARVTLLSDASAQIADSPDLHALCLAEGFYPGFVEIKWRMAGKAITEGVTPGQVIVNDDGSYSTTSVLTVPRNRLYHNALLKCLVHHYSSGSKTERSLELC
uniref:immunoglobulin lambda-1 light chain-like n=1 Tax=Euleptes europaea TaxID=460621 RepID=UPI0025405057|nr:immunoglobulin lambda-1 light chain-like [Euleptes europaea]